MGPDNTNVTNISMGEDLSLSAGAFSDTFAESGGNPPANDSPPGCLVGSNTMSNVDPMAVGNSMTSFTGGFTI